MAKLTGTGTRRSDHEESVWIGHTGVLPDMEFIPLFNIEKIQSRKKNLWRYREAIPILNDENIISVEEGFTPLLEMQFDGKPAWIKQEQLFLSGSFKDRGATVLLSKAKELGIKKVVGDSSGNAGCAIAMYAAMANIECDMYVPDKTSEAKLAQMKCYGAVIHKVAGNREDTAMEALKAAQQNYDASHYRNPFFFQGTKTFAYEVCEQLNWKAPDAVVLPVGNGTLVIGCYIGFNELLNAGIITQLPKIIAVQTANCSPLFQTFHNGLSDIQSLQTGTTMAEGIAIANPARGKQIVHYVKRTNGDFLAVNEQEIIESFKLCGRMGYYIEPTSAAAIAGLRKYLKRSTDEIVVSLFSGHGLKATGKFLYT